MVSSLLESTKSPEKKSKFTELSKAPKLTRLIKLLAR